MSISGHGLRRAAVSSLLVPSTRAGTSSSVTTTLGQSVRHSHVGSAPLYLPATTSLEVLPFPPHPNPSRPLSTSLRYAKSIVVRGPLGEIVVPLQQSVELDIEAPKSAAASPSASSSSSSSSSSPSSSAAAAAPTPAGSADASASDAEPRKLTLRILDPTEKAQRSFWGLTRALLSNAITGVSEGHSIALRLVGVGYRATVEPDPLPRTSKLHAALASNRTFFLNDQQRAWQVERLAGLERSAELRGPRMRLNIRLGYSHPVLLPVPHGVTATTPQPNRILLRGADKEALGLFASQIRSWRKPEPYKGKGVFVGDETIRLRTPKKK